MRTLFSEISQATTLTIVAHTKISQDVLSILQNTVNEKTMNIIPMGKFREELIQIADSLDAQRKMPIDVKHEIFRYIKIETVLMNGKLVVVFKVPLLETEKFLLYKAVFTPAEYQNETFVIVPDDEYFLVNIEKLECIPIKQEDLSSCIPTLKNGWICTPSAPSIVDTNRICSMQIMFHPQRGNFSDICMLKKVPRANYLITIDRLNTYFCSIFEPMTIRYGCEREKPSVFTLSESGILRLNENCGLWAGKFRIKAHVQKVMNKSEIISPFATLETFPFNFGNRTLRSPFLEGEGAILIKDHTRDFRRLSDEVDKEMSSLEHQKRFENIHYDAIDHKIFTVMNAVLLFIIFGIGAGCIACIWKKIKFVVSGYNSFLKLFGRNNKSGVPHVHFQNESSVSEEGSPSTGTQTTIFKV